MSDTMTRTTDQTEVEDRRRPGRIANPSPDLIVLMRKPSPEVERSLALYDAPNFVLPEAGGDLTNINFYQLAHFAGAFALCAAGWVIAFRVMMSLWG